MIRCSACRVERDEKQVAFYQQVSGWARINRRAGGVNSLKQMKRHDQFICSGCLLADELGGQETLPLDL